MKQLEHLTEEERNDLFAAPVLLSVLASCTGGSINKEQKAEAIRLAHLKTFTADPLLIPFYREVEKHFGSRFEEAVRRYAPFDDSKRDELKGKINKDYAGRLIRSFEKYEHHVSKAGHSVIEDFIFPMPLPGFKD